MFHMNCTCHFNGLCPIHVNNQRPPDLGAILLNAIRNTNEEMRNQFIEMQNHPFHQLLLQQFQNIDQQLLQQMDFIAGAYQQPQVYYRIPNYQPNEMRQLGNEVVNNNNRMGNINEGVGVVARNEIREGDYEEVDEGDAPPDDMEQENDEEDQEDEHGEAQREQGEQEPDDPGPIRVDHRVNTGRTKHIIINDDISGLAQINYRQRMRNPPLNNGQIIPILPIFRAEFGRYRNNEIPINVIIYGASEVVALQFDRLEYSKGNVAVYDLVEETARSRLCELLNLDPMFNHLFYISIKVSFPATTIQGHNSDPSDFVAFKSIQIE